MIPRAARSFFVRSIPNIVIDKEGFAYWLKSMAIGFTIPALATALHMKQEVAQLALHATPSHSIWRLHIDGNIWGAMQHSPDINVFRILKLENEMGGIRRAARSAIQEDSVRVCCAERRRISLQRYLSF